MNCIAIDDEPLALDIIEDYVAKIPALTLAAKCTSAIEASEIIQNQDINLIFCDIQMPHITGIEFIKNLENKPLVIFTTAYPDYALDSYELNAIDYLVKPIAFDRFLKAVNKATEFFSLKNKKDTEETAFDFLMIKVEYRTVRVNLSDIIYIEGVKDYLKIHTPKKRYLTKNTMKNMDAKLPSSDFIRVHKSYIVALAHIDSIERHRIVFGEKRIPVGEVYKEKFHETLKKFSL